MNIILLAPPAAGKGTQSARITSTYHLKHISTGDLLREAMKKGDEMAVSIKKVCDEGKLVSDDIILTLIENELKDASGVVLDGFPRNLTQAVKYDELLESLNQTLDAVIYLCGNKEVLEARVIGRATCPSCGTIYNSMIEGQKPQVENICDHCNVALTHRSDDNKETFAARYETYMHETEPLVRYYSSKGILTEIDATQDPDQVFVEIQKVLEKIK